MSTRSSQRPAVATLATTDASLADQLGALARTLEHDDDILTAIVLAAVETVPGAVEASISAIKRRRDVETLAATGEMAAEVDRVQYSTAQGPCLDSLYDEQTVRLPDLTDEQRWPAFVTRARELGVGSMLAVQLYVEGDSLGALNLYGDHADAFTSESEHVALLFASHAAVALSGAQQRDRLRLAMTTRDVIGQAKGILMERFKITGDQAFRLLVRVSQQGNRKLYDVAEQLVSTGDLPADGSGR